MSSDGRVKGRRIAPALWLASWTTIALWNAGALAEETPAAPPSDDALTCEQIAAELAPYAQQLMPNLQALAASNQQLYAQGRQRYEQHKAEEIPLTALAGAAALDPTGAAKRAYDAAVMVDMARQRSENEAVAKSPLYKQNRAQNETLAAQAQEMKGNARLQRLMQLGHDKHCDRK